MTVLLLLLSPLWPEVWFLMFAHEWRRNLRSTICERRGILEGLIDELQGGRGR